MSAIAEVTKLRRESTQGAEVPNMKDPGRCSRLTQPALPFILTCIWRLPKIVMPA